MKIAYLSSRYPEVSHTFIRREVKALRRLGVDVHTFTLRRSNQLRSPEDMSEAESTFALVPTRVFRLLLAHARALARKPASYLDSLIEAFRHRIPGVKNTIWALFHFAEAILLADQLTRRGIRHLHCHFANAGGDVAYLAVRYLGIDLSYTVHGSADFDAPTRPLLGTKLAYARFIACVSHYGRSQVMRVLPPQHWGRVFVVRCGLETDGIRAVRAQSNRAQPLILCVGRLVPEKGHICLVEAFAKLRARGIDARLRILGEGPDRRRIESRIHALGIADHCELPGAVSEQTVLREMASASVFALASFMEGLPVAIMEALLLGLPVVAPRVAGIPELIEHGRTGLLFTPARDDELCSCLESILASPLERNRMAAEGLRRILSDFDVDSVVVPLHDHFRAAARARGDEAA